MSSYFKDIPLVSICIPTYQGEKFIKEALSSVLLQTYSHIEIIFSDDASTDKTVEIAKLFKEKSSFNFEIITHKQFGLVHNWNFCVSQAKGKYIKFLFQDDLLEPDCVKQMVELAEQNDNIGLVFSPRGMILAEDADSDPGCVGVYQECGNLHKAWSCLKPIQSGQELLLDPNLIKDPINKIGEPSSVLIRKQVFDEVGLFDSNLYQLIDVDMWFRIMSRYKIGFVDKTLSHFRIHLQQQTRTNIDSGESLLDNQRFAYKILNDSCYNSLPQKLKEHIAFTLEMIVVDELRFQLQNSQKEVKQLREQLYKTPEELRFHLENSHREVEQLRGQLYKVQLDSQRYFDEVEAMKTSKFWKLRTAWFRIKNRIGLVTD